MNLRRVHAALLLFLLFFILAVGISYPGLSAPFSYDSAAKLEERAHFFDDGIVSALKMFPQRPLPVLCFYWDYLLAGMTPLMFRLTNLFIWAELCTLLVFLLDLILDTPALAGLIHREDREWICILGGLAFLVHPLGTYVTLYIWQRMALMGCLLYYAALALHLAARTCRIERARLGIGLAIVLFMGALLSKENAVTLPFAIVLAEMALFRQSWKTAFKAAAPYFVALLACIMLLSLVQFPHGNEGLPAGIRSTLARYYQESGLGAGEVLLTQCLVLFAYLSLILLPLPGRVQLVSPQVISRSLLDPPETFVAVIGVIALVSLGMYLVKRRPLSGFGILFFLLNMIPEGVLVPQYAYFAYRALLPMLGIYLVIIDAIIWLLGLVKDSSRLRVVRSGFLCLAVAAAVLLGMASAARAAIWGDEIRFWKETVAAFPQDLNRSESRPAGQAYANLGTALFRKGRYAAAIESYKRSLGFLPDNAVARAALGLAYARMGQEEKAEASLREALRLNPDLALAHQGLGDLLTGKGKLEEGRLHLQKAAHSYARTIR